MAGRLKAKRKPPAAAPARPTSEQAALEKSADAYRQTRKAHHKELAEDYVELIAELIETVGEARAVDIARRLGVTHVTVVKTVARLARDGLVITRPYRSIFLTEAGRQIAAESRHRHQIVVRFLRALGVSSPTAETDAEGIEHHVSVETLAAFERFCAGTSAKPDERPTS